MEAVVQNVIVKAWIQNAVSPELASSLIYNPTTQSIWEDLREYVLQGGWNSNFAATSRYLPCYSRSSSDVFQTSENVVG